MITAKQRNQTNTCRWITCLEPENLLHKYLYVDNSNRLCGLFIVLSGDLWLTGMFLAVCGVAVGIWCSTILLGRSTVDWRLCGVVSTVGRIWLVGGVAEQRKRW
jgi:hypothetical protein